MTAPAPTALPWRTSLPDDTTIIGPDREGVATMLGDYDADAEWPVMEANAALIVRAVNCHEALVDALEECLTAERRRREQLKPGAPASTYTEARIGMLQDVLARAKGAAT